MPDRLEEIRQSFQDDGRGIDDLDAEWLLQHALWLRGEIQRQPPPPDSYNSGYRGCMGVATALIVIGGGGLLLYVVMMAGATVLDALKNMP